MEIFPIFDRMLSREEKEQLLGQRGIMIWMTGLSGSGKSTLAIAVEKELHRRGILCRILDGDNIRHIGGIGVGGGTLQGLARIMLKTSDIRQVVELSKDGDISKINVLIGDISPRPLPGLPSDAIASLFGNAQSDARREDIALGILWTVLRHRGENDLGMGAQHGKLYVEG